MAGILTIRLRIRKFFVIIFFHLKIVFFLHYYSYGEFEMKIKPYYVEDAYHPGDTKACGPLGMIMRGIEVRIILFLSFTVS